MTDEIVKEQGKQSLVSIRRAPGSRRVEDPDQAIVKHAKFLALLKKQYGYTNEKAVDELERLLKLFYTMNRSLSIHHKHSNIKHPSVVT
jgi:hypothetical protein